MSELAISCKETFEEKCFFGILKRARPSIQRWSASAKNRVSHNDIQQHAALAVAAAIPLYVPKEGTFEAVLPAHLMQEFGDAAAASRHVHIPHTRNAASLLTTSSR